MKISAAAKEGYLEKLQGRVIFILTKTLSSEDFNRLLCLHAFDAHDTIKEEFDNRIEINIRFDSKDPKENVVIVDGEEYSVLGTDSKFVSQFKS